MNNTHGWVTDINQGNVKGKVEIEVSIEVAILDRFGSESTLFFYTSVVTLKFCVNEPK